MEARKGIEPSDVQTGKKEIIDYTNMSMVDILDVIKKATNKCKAEFICKR